MFNLEVKLPKPGAVIETSPSPWKVLGWEKGDAGFRILHCKVIAGITKGKEASFVFELGVRVSKILIQLKQRWYLINQAV